MKKYMPSNRYEVILLSAGVLLPIALIIILLVVMIYISEEADKKWAAFSAEHNCKVVAKISGSTFNTYSVNPQGQMQVGVGSTPDKTGWLCDDGVTYYR